MWEVVQVSSTGVEVVVAGWLPYHLAVKLKEHYEVGCLPGETVRVQRDPESPVN